MRTMDPAMIASVHGDAACLVDFFELHFSSGVVRFVTGPLDLTWDGKDWVAIGGLLDYDGFTEAPDSASGAVTCRLSGVDQSIIALVLGQNCIGRAARIWHGHVTIGGNLIENADLESDALGLNGNVSTASRSTDLVLPPSVYAAKCVTTDASGSGLFWSTRAGGPTPALPGVEYTFRCWARVAPGSTPKNLRIAVEFWDNTPAYISLGSGPAYGVAYEGGWMSFTVTTIAPPNTAYAYPELYCDGAQGVFTFYVEQPQLEYGNRANPWVATNTGAILSGTVTPNPLNLFTGYLNGSWKLTEERGERDGSTATVETRLLSPLASFRGPRGIMCNIASHGRYYPGIAQSMKADQFFEFVPTLTGKKIQWGIPRSWREFADKIFKD